MNHELKEKFRSILAGAVVITLLGWLIYSLILEQHWIILGIVIFGIILFVGFILLLGLSLESGFRNRFPMDYLFQLNQELIYFKEKGFSEKEYTYPGGDNPGVILERDGKLIEIKLHAPLMANKFTTTISSPNEKTLSLEYDTSLDLTEKISKLDFFYQELDKTEAAQAAIEE